MAVSKHTRRPVSDTNQRIQKFFHSSTASSDDREQEWRQAVQYAGTGTPPLRFPVYEHLYFLNVYSQRLVDLIREINDKFGICPQDSLYHESMIQQVRAGVTGDILGSMHGVEITEDWLFGVLRKEQEKGLRDPDDVYFDVRRREEERIKAGLSPRLHFLDEELATQKRPSTVKKTK